MFDFRFNTPIPSLNQDQRSVFMIWECAQSILRLEKPRNRRFSHKNPKCFDFRFNTPIPSLNQGQGSVFTLREYAESISRIKLPQESHLFKKVFRRMTPQMAPSFKTINAFIMYKIVSFFHVSIDDKKFCRINKSFKQKMIRKLKILVKNGQMSMKKLLKNGRFCPNFR